MNTITRNEMYAGIASVTSPLALCRSKSKPLITGFALVALLTMGPAGDASAAIEWISEPSFYRERTKAWLRSLAPMGGG